MQFTIAAGNEGGGGFMALMGLLLVQVGFSFDAVGEIMTANIFVSNFAAFISLIMRDCDLLAFSHSLKQISP